MSRHSNLIEDLANGAAGLLNVTVRRAVVVGAIC